MKKLFTILALLMLALPHTAHAQDIAQERLRFAPGKTQTTVSDQIVGREIVDYVFDAKHGQTISVRFAPTSPFAFFNLLAPNGEALFVGQDVGNPGRFDARLGATGRYTIRVYIVRAEARRGGSADYRLSVSITGGQPLPDENAGVPEDGGPDFYVVAGLSPGEALNMRRGPSVGDAVIAKLPNGKIVKNLGCRKIGASRWCQVQNPKISSQRGWVNGRFLRESSAPRPNDEDALVPGTNYNATGDVDCAIAGYPRVRSCPFGVVRGGEDQATVFISLPDGEKRVLEFENGRVRSLSGISSFSFRREGDEYFININRGQERFTVFDAVINGG